jgi:hypothetical protein
MSGALPHASAIPNGCAPDMRTLTGQLHQLRDVAD